MGTEQPYPPRATAQKSGKWKTSTGAALLLLLAAGMVKKEFSSTEVSPKPAAQDSVRLEKRLREIDESEQYALIASVNGWYPCLHKGRPGCYLLSGEIWKYGVTSKGEFGRYSAAFLMQNKVSYVFSSGEILQSASNRNKSNYLHTPGCPKTLSGPRPTGSQDRPTIPSCVDHH